MAVHRSSGETIAATAVNISGGGMLLHLSTPSEFQEDDVVTVEIELAESPDRPFSAWGVARVVRIDSRGFGVQLSAGTFPSAAAGAVAGQ